MFAVRRSVITVLFRAPKPPSPPFREPLGDVLGELETEEDGDDELFETEFASRRKI
jgi:hypothetical protein